MFKKLFIIILLMFSTFDISQSNIVSVVYSTSLEFPKLDSWTIRDIYTLRTKYDDEGDPITIIHMNEHSYEYEFFIENFLFLSLRSYKNIITQERAKGSKLYIKYADTSYDVINMVRSIPASIGYVNSTIYINTGVNNEIRIIDINTGNF